MTRKKCDAKERKVGLKLSIEERKLILAVSVHLHKALANPIRATPTGAPVLLTLDDLEDPGGYVAAEANHTSDTKVRKKLDAIFSKIQDLLESHSDYKSPKSLKIEEAGRKKLIADQSVQLAERAARMLIGAEQLGIKDKPVAQFLLPWAERAVLLLFTAVDKDTLKKLKSEKPTLTVGEVGGLLMVIAEAMIDAPSSQCHALSMTAKSLMDFLVAEVTEASNAGSEEAP